MWPYKKAPPRKTVEQAMEELILRSEFDTCAQIQVNFLHDGEYRFVVNSVSHSTELLVSPQLWPHVKSLRESREYLAKIKRDRKKKAEEANVEKVESHPHERKIIFTPTPTKPEDPPA